MNKWIFFGVGVFNLLVGMIRIVNHYQGYFGATGYINCACAGINLSIFSDRRKDV